VDGGDFAVGWQWNEEKNQLSFKDGSTVNGIPGDNFTLCPLGRLVAATAAGACFSIFHNRRQSTFKSATRSVWVGRRHCESHVLLPPSWSCFVVVVICSLYLVIFRPLRQLHSVYTGTTFETIVAFSVYFSIY